MMKILYVISVMKAGKGGGHAYSLEQISRSIFDSVDEIGILSIGLRESQNFQDLPFYMGNIYFNGINFFSAGKKIRERVESYSPDIIHCFDYNCYNVFKSLMLNKKYQFILNKCGGPNQESYPVAERIILFSKENQNWFEKRSKYNKTVFYLIPNRVQKVEVETKVEISKPLNTFSFVRIIRIGKTYQTSVLKSISLIEELSKRGYRVNLYVIGVIEDQMVFDDIKIKARGKNVIFLTEDKFTSGASKMLYLADAVIATGRGAMEASSLGIPVLSLTSNSRYPTLVTKSNFDRFFEKNFSGRLKSVEEESTLSTIERLIEDEKFYSECGQSMQSFFDKYFNVDNAKRQYLNVYREALVDSYRVPFYYDIFNKLRTLRAFFIHSRKYR